jgi:hypothetical protein
LRDVEKLQEKQLEGISEGKTDVNSPINGAISEIADKLKYTLDNEEDEDTKQLELGGDDFIISNNYLQILDGREKDNY